jgi:hypothetical protein
MNTYLIVGIGVIILIFTTLATFKEPFTTYKETSQLAFDINKWINEKSPNVTFGDYLKFTKGKRGVSYNLLKPETFYKMMAYKKDNKLNPIVIDEFAK